ncbi:MAG: ATP-binding protein [Lachnospiraceae bacterium]
MIRLWSNLLQNAIRYGKPGGHIWVSVEKGKPDPDERKGRRDWDRPGDLPHIWDRFYRRSLEKFRKQWVRLSMAKWIVEALAGKYSPSASRKGTTFTCIFPAD